MKPKKYLNAAKRAAEKATERAAVRKGPDPEASSLDDIQVGAIARAPEDMYPEEYDSDIPSAGLTAGEVVQVKRKKRRSK